MIAALVFLIAFLLARILRGKEYAKDWIFDGFVGLAGIVLVGVCVFVYQLVLVMPQKLDSEQRSSISKLSKVTNSLSASIINLSSQVAALEKQHERDSSALEAVAAVTGATNGTFIQNAEHLMDKVTDIQSELSRINDNLYAPQATESFSLIDTNRVTVFYPTNGGPEVFFKLRGVPLQGTVTGMAQGGTVLGQVPLLINGVFRNVAWIVFPELTGLDKTTFIIFYRIDKNQTNIVHNVWTNKGNLMFDHTHLNIQWPNG